MPLDHKDKIVIGSVLVLALLWYDVHQREADQNHATAQDNLASL
jgi:hypothetical protein